mgnify:CR=1 FL=1
MLTRNRLLAGAAALAAASFVVPAFAQEPIKIGELNSYKNFAAFLEPYKKGWELAVEEVNAAGGVLGRKIEIVSRDDNGVPGDAVRVAEELLSREKVAFLIGTFPSNVGLAVADFAKQRKTLLSRCRSNNSSWMNKTCYARSRKMYLTHQPKLTNSRLRRNVLLLKNASLVCKSALKPLSIVKNSSSNNRLRESRLVRN